MKNGRKDDREIWESRDEREQNTRCVEKEERTKKNECKREREKHV